MEKEVEEVAAPKVTEEETEEKAPAVENGSEETTENGSEDKEDEEKETNGSDSTGNGWKLWYSRKGSSGHPLFFLS